MSLPTFTIDPVTARDFDDAISAESTADGGWRVWVHIADVSFYVPQRSLVDREAYRRATSVYVPGTVEPMLPQSLSNGACSLVPGEVRPTLTVELTIGTRGVRGASIYRSLIRSDVRLDYDRVDRIFAGSETAAAPWGEPLAAARAAAGALDALRRGRSAVVLQSAEPDFRFDRRGDVVAGRADAADRVPPADRASDDRRQRAGGAVPGGAQDPGAVPGARAARVGGRRPPGRPAGVARGADAAGARRPPVRHPGGRDRGARRRSWSPPGWRGPDVADGR